MNVKQTYLTQDSGISNSGWHENEKEKKNGKRKTSNSSPILIPDLGG